MSTPSVKTLFIFDWDGTLLDVSKQILHALESSINEIISNPDLQEQYPILSSLQPVCKNDLRPFLGHRFKEKILPTLYPEVCSDADLVTLFYQKFLSYYSVKKSSLFPEVDNFLHRIKQHPDCGLALATNKSRSLLLRELQQHNLTLLFDSVVCGDDPSHGGRAKPEPDMINRIQDTFPQAETCYMIGDSSADILAAQQAAKPTISIVVVNEPCASSESDLQEFKPDRMLHRADLPGYISSLLQQSGSTSCA